VETLLDILRGGTGPRPLRLPAKTEVVDLSYAEQDAWAKLASLLVARGEIEALAEGLAGLDPIARAYVVSAVVAGSAGLLDGAAPDPAEGIVAEGLQDAAPHEGYRDVLGPCPDARIADLTAAGLARRFPSRFPFRGSAAREVRDARIVRMRNALRARAGEEPLPEPPLPSVEPVPDEKVASLLAAFDAPELDALVAAEESAAAAGLGALPGLRRALGENRPPGATGAALDRAVRRLASTVRRVHVRPGADERAIAALRAAAGAPLDPADLTSMLRALLDAGVAVEILVHRPGDDTGASLVVAPGPEGGRYRMRISGVLSQGVARHLDDETWSRVEEELAAGAALEPGAPFAIRLRLRP
jgi:hypothetical protein